MPEERTYWGLGQGVWIRDRLIEAGPAGLTVADLHRERVRRRRELGLGSVKRPGTYSSLARYFHWFKQLGWVEEVKITEPSTIRGTDLKTILKERRRYRITDEGLRHPEHEWSDPIRIATAGKWTGPVRRHYRRRVKMICQDCGETFEIYYDEPSPRCPKCLSYRVERRRRGRVRAKRVRE